MSDHDEFTRKYEELETLGEGGAAVVKKCRHRETQVLYASKQMRRYDEEKEASSKQEFDLIKRLKEHPNIVKAQEFIATERWTHTIMELAEGIELQNYVK